MPGTTDSDSPAVVVNGNGYLQCTRDLKSQTSRTSTTGISSLASSSRPPSPVIPATQYRPLIDRINRRIEKNKRFFSCEFFPPRTASGAVNLISKFDRFRKGNPLFCDITWHPAGDPTSDKPTSSTMIASSMLNYSAIDTMLHVTCCDTNKEKMRQGLDKIKCLGIKNILALRGDLPDDTDDWGLSDDGLNYAVDLVRFIRETYGNYFNICVAGYPTGHPEAASYEDDLQRLKEKVDAGADFIITQLFFKAETFLTFLRDCRKLGINCPIIPGILPIQAYQSLRHIVKLSKLSVPQEIIDTIEPIKENDEAIRNYGIHHATELCKELFLSGQVTGIHFYTLNREVATIEILKRIDLWAEGEIQRALPWKPSANHERCSELIRPVFWSNRPTSYVHRTSHWEEFPNGRWGRPDAATFGDLKDYYLFYLTVRASKEEKLKMWGRELQTEQDIWKVFENYVTGDTSAEGKKVSRLPWNDEELHDETSLISENLRRLITKGVLTINSQPNVNGVKSTDPILGWGNSDGYCYQRAYLEFFIPRKFLQGLLDALAQVGDRVSFQIADRSGQIDFLNFDKNQPIALTWGIFSASEIIQPTIVDHNAFQIWKEEAYELWMKEWGVIYPEGSSSRGLIQHIMDSYLLVTLIDNDFPLENCLWALVEKAISQV